MSEKTYWIEAHREGHGKKFYTGKREFSEMWNSNPDTAKLIKQPAMARKLARRLRQEYMLGQVFLVEHCYGKEDFYHVC
jgi:hypothetical protein